MATSLARMSGGKIILLHVTPPLNYSTMYTGSLTVGLSQQMMTEVHKAAQDTSIAALRAVAERHAAGLDVEFEARPGVPLSVILAEAERHSADLIVLAASGRSRVARFFVGSTADRVIREANCPVLVIPAHPVV
jgi:nucleotide-binding universal stress UspA family protein